MLIFAMRCVKLVHMNVKKSYLLLLVICSAAGGYILRQSTAVLETKIVTKDVIKDRIVTVVRTVKSPDGTETRDERTEQDRDTTRRSQTVVETAAPLKDWKVSAGYMIDRTYTGAIERRILGPVFLGVQGDSQGRLGAIVSIEF